MEHSKIHAVDELAIDATLVPGEAKTDQRIL
jgi:hypothetical protein